MSARMPTHDVFGYLPSARALAEGGYETRGVHMGAGPFYAANRGRRNARRARDGGSKPAANRRRGSERSDRLERLSLPRDRPLGLTFVKLRLIRARDLFRAP